MRKALVIQLARFGDIIQTKRLLLTLLSRFDEVHFAVDASQTLLARLIYPGVRIHEVLAHGGRGSMDMFTVNRCTFATLAAKKFDAVYNLNFSRLNLAMSTLFDAQSIHGYYMQDGQPVVPLWARMAFRWTRRRVVAPMNLVDFWAGFASHPLAAGAVNPIAGPKGGGIGVVLAGRESRRSLPPAVLARCVRAIFESLGAPSVTLLGSKGEKALAHQVLRHFSGPMLDHVTNLAGKTDYKALMDVVGTFDTLLSPDTGTMHLAAHLGTPVQAFFLSSAWCYETGPYGLGHKVWQAYTDCSPCEEVRPCPVNVACLQGFSDKRFLGLLAGRPTEEYPPVMTGLASTIDSLGVTYLPVFGADPMSAMRRELRALVLEFLNKRAVSCHSVPARHCMPPQDRHELAQRLFHESDWMLNSSSAATFAEILVD